VGNVQYLFKWSYFHIDVELAMAGEDYGRLIKYAGKDNVYLLEGAVIWNRDGHENKLE